MTGVFETFPKAHIEHTDPITYQEHGMAIQEVPATFRRRTTIIPPQHRIVALDPYRTHGHTELYLEHGMAMTLVLHPHLYQETYIWNRCF